MIARKAEVQLKKLAEQFPAILILGPRQCGKTTLARNCVRGQYFDLEKPSDAQIFSDDIEFALRRFPGSVIVDEAQVIPAIFPVLRALIDEARQEYGRFFLLGSVSPELIKGISESLSTEHDWAQRRAFLEPLRRQSMEEIRREQDKTNISLALFRPKRIETLIIGPADPSWSPEQVAALQQQQFFDNDKPVPLEKIPCDFKYRYICDDPKCKGHEQSIVDWEIYQSYRRWRKEYGEKWEEKLRQRYEYDMQQRNDTHFIVGTMRGYPQSWIIIGLFYPPQAEGQQGVLFTDC